MDERKIAYFSMEIELESKIPTYSGGLGVLAGDTIRSAADLQIPIVAVSLLHRTGYFQQVLDAGGHQSEQPVDWKVEDFLQEEPARHAVTIEERFVQLRAWRYEVKGVSGYMVPVYLLDTDLEENTPWDRSLTLALYGGDWYYRLCQEVILGIGGVRMLRALGHVEVERFHMNEGHASLLTLELMQEEARRNGRESIEIADLAAVRQKCIFTTHTPVPAGHDQFPLHEVSRVLGYRDDLKGVFGSQDVARRVLAQRHNGPAPENFPDSWSTLNMTYLALNMSRYVNGVAKKHGEISRLMFAGYQIDAITNGVHAASWAAPAFQELFDQHIPDWRQDNFSLRHAESIPRREVWSAHLRCKEELFNYIKELTGMELDVSVLTLGFARRATSYKRADLLFTDIERLKSIPQEDGPLQIVYAGKAHPKDEAGKQLICRIFQMSEMLATEIKVVYLANYDIAMARLLTSGVDVWVNTPQPPMEASGTSGMKAAINGIPSLSILDGWWIEGLIEGVTGWSIGDEPRSLQKPGDTQSDSASLYDKLENQVIPLYYTDREGFLDVMRHAIALNGSFFNTQRMLQQYVTRAYFG
jgi:starch phosphorylase